MPKHDIWIGSDYYLPSNGVLILGESTYANGERDEQPLREYIPDWICGKVPKDHTFNCMFHAFSEGQVLWARATEEQKWAFWNSIAFYNFVCRLLLSSKAHPTSPDLHAAQEPLSRVLLEYRPRGVIILGKHSEHSLPMITKLNIPVVSTHHPRGGKIEDLTRDWNGLRRILSAQ